MTVSVTLQTGQIIYYDGSEVTQASEQSKKRDACADSRI